MAGGGDGDRARAALQDPTDPQLCPPATVEGCANPQTTCDHGWLEDAKVHEQSPCNDLLHDHATAVLAGLPTRTVLTTTTTNGPLSQVPDAPKKDVPFFLVAPASKNTTGLDSTYMGGIEQAM